MNKRAGVMSARLFNWLHDLRRVTYLNHKTISGTRNKRNNLLS